MRKTTLLAAFGITASLTLWYGRLAGAAEEDPFAGVYDCLGSNADGQQYVGVVQIVRTDQTYAVQWTIGGQTHFGAGLAAGEDLAVGWAVQTARGVEHGVVVYHRADDGLAGRWTAYGSGKAFDERLRRMPPLATR